jgi:hypothetical protein
MVRLNDDQERKLYAVKASKQRFDKELLKLEADFEAKKEALKGPIRLAVAEAASAGVPTRRIHIDGLQFAQVSSMMNFLEDKRKSLGERIADLASGETAPEIQREVDAPVVVWYPDGTNEFQVEFGDELQTVQVGEPEEGVTVVVAVGEDDDDWPDWLHDAVDAQYPDAYHGYTAYLTGDDE